ncbi:unnamed protein product, partial [Mesorhabditis spiculigera]
MRVLGACIALLSISSIIAQPVAQDQHVLLTNENHDQVLNSATVFKREHPDKSAVFAIVDSVAHADVADRYFVNKYPTMKYWVNGELVTKEYRGTRSVDALTTHVLEQLSTAMNEFPSQEYIDTHLDRSKRNVLVYTKDRNSVAFSNLKKAAMILREDCSFWVSDPALAAPSGADIQGNMISFVDPDTGDHQQYTMSMENYDLMKQWLTDKCIPLVREVTFENVEELTEEGLPFLIFFRDVNNKEHDKMFTDAVVRELYDIKGAVNPLFADGKKFAHPLRHLGKTQKDLPVLAIDSFQHMFLFPDMSQVSAPGKLRQFVEDLNSGKLHKEFHESLDQKMMDLAKFKSENGIEEEHEQDGDARPGGQGPPGHRPKTDPPPSVFKELKPSGKRYSLLMKQEL